METTGEQRSTQYFFQRLSVAVQRFNSVAFRGTFENYAMQSTGSSRQHALKKHVSSNKKQHFFKKQHVLKSNVLCTNGGKLQVEPLPRAGSSRGGDAVQLDNVLKGSPPTPRYQRQRQDSGPNVLTVDHEQLEVKGGVDFADLETTMLSTQMTAGVSDENSEGDYDEVDASLLMGRRQQFDGTETVVARQLQGLTLSEESKSMKWMPMTEKEEDKSGTKSKRQRFQPENTVKTGGHWTHSKEEEDKCGTSAAKSNRRRANRTRGRLVDDTSASSSFAPNETMTTNDKPHQPHKTVSSEQGVNEEQARSDQRESSNGVFQDRETAFNTSSMSSSSVWIGDVEQVMERNAEGKECGDKEESEDELLDTVLRYQKTMEQMRDAAPTDVEHRRRHVVSRHESFANDLSDRTAAITTL